MPLTHAEEIKMYAYDFFSSRARDSVSERIRLCGADGTIFGTIHFQDDASTLNTAVKTSPVGITIFYRRSMLPHIIDMLRNEKPIYLCWYPPHAKSSDKIPDAWLTTTGEPTGEEEA